MSYIFFIERLGMLHQKPFSNQRTPHELLDPAISIKKIIFNFFFEIIYIFFLEISYIYLPAAVFFLRFSDHQL